MLRLLAKRNKELGGARTRTACRLHALLVELVPGGITKQITANRAAALLASVTPAGPVEATRHALALEHLEDLRRIDGQMRASKQRISDAVKASGTTTTETGRSSSRCARSRSCVSPWWRRTLPVGP